MAAPTSRILAADIGGTSSRFGCFQSDGKDLVLEEAVVLPTTSANSFPELIQMAVEKSPAMRPALTEAAAFAVPGAVRGKHPVVMPNVAWSIQWDDAQAAVGDVKLTLINDFAAQAYATATPAMFGAEVVKTGEAYKMGARAVVGAGTGLGHCALMPLEGGGVAVVPAEMGHAGFPFVGEEEHAFQVYLMRELEIPYPITELAVSGRGLSNIHAFLTGEKLPPDEVSKRFEQHPKVLEWFARFYGRACRQYALAVVASGGLVISGGIAAKHPEVVTHPAFALEFVNSVTQREILEAIPITRNANELSGLWGAGYAGQQSLQRSATT